MASVAVMEILRHIVVLVHLVGFAVLFGSWVVEAVNRRHRQVTPAHELGPGHRRRRGARPRGPVGASRTS